MAQQFYHEFLHISKLRISFHLDLEEDLAINHLTIFTEDSERLQYQNVLPIDKDNNKLERSYGLNLDFNYVTSIFDGNVTFSINQLFFYTYLDNPLLLQSTKDGLYRLNNISGNTDSKGGETNVKNRIQKISTYT